MLRGSAVPTAAPTACSSTTSRADRRRVITITAVVSRCTHLMMHGGKLLLLLLLPLEIGEEGLAGGIIEVGVVGG